MTSHAILYRLGRFQVGAIDLNRPAVRVNRPYQFDRLARHTQIRIGIHQEFEIGFNFREFKSLQRRIGLFPDFL